MKKGCKKVLAIGVALSVIITSFNWNEIPSVANDTNIVDYNGATVMSNGSISNGSATIRGLGAKIDVDSETNSNVLVLNGEAFSDGYLELPKNLYSEVTNAFTFTMDINVSDNASNYQRLFQSSSIPLGSGDTSWWDAPDVSIDLGDFNQFRSSVLVGSTTHTADDGSHRALFNWGTGAQKNHWSRLVFTVTQNSVTVFYNGIKYTPNVNSTVLANLFSNNQIQDYIYNAIGHSVYSSDGDAKAKFDNIKVYSRALSDVEAVSEQLPVDATYSWDFDNADLTLKDSSGSLDAFNIYTDGTNLTESTTASSPDNSIKVGIYKDSTNGRFFYSVMKNNNTVINASAIGLTTENGDYTRDLTIDNSSIKITSGTDSYKLLNGKTKDVSDSYNELSFTLNGLKGNIDIIIRIYDDGFAYRYQINESNLSSGVITSEASEIVLPDGSVTWSASPSDTYEGTYTKRSLTTITNSEVQMSTPLLASVKGDAYWLLFSEANVFNEKEPYCASIFETKMDQKNIQWVFGRNQDKSVSVNYPFKTPWRVAIITENLNKLANSNIITDLNPKADSSKDWSFVKPGKVAWSWWSSSFDAIEPQTQKDYIDFAAKNGWEYVLVDYGWELWDDYKTKVKDIVDYGKEKGVGVVLWYGVNKYDGKHIFELNNRKTIDEQFAWCKDIGIVGVKIDYLNSDSQESMKIMYDLADSSAENRLMLLYHGSSDPNGESRTYPNIISTESVRGSEYYKWGIGADVKTLLTYMFTRNVLGSMDFTPVAYPLTSLGVTAGFQAAETIIFESGLQHFAHSAYVYEGSKILSLLNDIPVTWDNSLFGGYPGEYNWAARQSGDDWYLGVMTAASIKTNISLDFLEDGKTYKAYIYGDNKDGSEVSVTEMNLTSNDIFALDIKENSGVAVKITENNMKTSTYYDDTYNYYEAEDALLSGSSKIDVNNYASSLASVGWVGNGDKNDLVFDNINVDKSGVYDMKIFFITGAKRDLYISINDNDPILLKDLLSYNSDWSAVGSKTIAVSLKEGKNKIRLFNKSAFAPSIDRIAVSKNIVDKKSESTVGTDKNISNMNINSVEKTPETGDVADVSIKVSIIILTMISIFIFRRKEIVNQK